MSREVMRTIEELEAVMNAERAQRNRNLIAKLEQEQQRENQAQRPKRRLFRRFLLVLCLVLAAILILAWIVLQRTHIVVGLGFLDLPFLAQIVQV